MGGNKESKEGREKKTKEREREETVCFIPPWLSRPGKVAAG